jgi:hypothetical protein
MPHNRSFVFFFGERREISDTFAIDRAIDKTANSVLGVAISAGREELHSKVHSELDARERQEVDLGVE